MKQYIVLLISLLFFSCGSDKIIQLPEISQSEITEIFDVSPAYLFYDVTQKDSVDLNRKNLIVTTNWLVNVDKRLSLKQAIPHIKFIQEKKRSSSHKNEAAKNYFTCHDTSIKNLGFVEFTNVVYHERSLPDFFTKNAKLASQKSIIEVHFDTNKNIAIQQQDLLLKTTDKANFITDLNEVTIENATVYLSFNSALSFQDYIYYKHQLFKSKQKLKVSENEFIY
ncbi:hypothetical protein FEZ18_08995 [Oceanihabitans sp. IOP_32]|uniref:hypothetical protein n=1 Tax=Oceanihabitans sp. IOP_32 TaxID=2529032 RepID=UPI001293DC6D|nr:hypothetical protein [Oceanihabitans sp. IOP_32]QFZ54926.1 hypothetical protein FEZ18_08995 [Oceanihabitans sp. IOP_32]